MFSDRLTSDTKPKITADRIMKRIGRRDGVDKTIRDGRSDGLGGMNVEAGGRTRLDDNGGGG